MQWKEIPSHANGTGTNGRDPASSGVPLLLGAATPRDSVKPRLKSSVREIRTLGSVGVAVPARAPFYLNTRAIAAPMIGGPVR